MVRMTPEQITRTIKQKTADVKRLEGQVSSLSGEVEAMEHQLAAKEVLIASLKQTQAKPAPPQRTDRTISNPFKIGFYGGLGVWVAWCLFLPLMFVGFWALLIIFGISLGALTSTASADQLQIEIPRNELVLIDRDGDQRGAEYSLRLTAHLLDDGSIRNFHGYLYPHWAADGFYTNSWYLPDGVGYFNSENDWAIDGEGWFFGYQGLTRTDFSIDQDGLSWTSPDRAVNAGAFSQSFEDRDGFDATITRTVPEPAGIALATFGVIFAMGVVERRTGRHRA